MCCVAVLAALLCIGIAFMTRKAYDTRNEANHLLVGIALIAALIFFCYFMASSVYVFMYRPFHYSEMIRTHSDPSDWDDTFSSSWSFEDGWGEDRRIIWWVAFFGILAAVGFLGTSVCLW